MARGTTSVGGLLWLVIPVVLVACSSGSVIVLDPTPSRTPSPTPAVQVSSLAPGSCRSDGIVPDSRCTPGATDPDVTPATIDKTICVRGWATARRAQLFPPGDELRVRAAVMAAYGVPSSEAPSRELDHLIAAEIGGLLGGPAIESNVWPEINDHPDGRLNTKDLVEDAASEAVCAHRIGLREAQQAMARDWRQLGRRLSVRGRGIPNP